MKLIVQVVALQLFLTFHLSRSLETPEPERFLKPRNFNPHPYRDTDRSDDGRSQLPVDEYPDLTTVATPEVTRRILDRHPYAEIARKYQKARDGRRLNAINLDNDKISPPVYRALASFAATKVLRRASPHPAQEIKPSYRQKTNAKNYEFSYAVRDHSSGDDFSHTQSQNGKATNGEYRVKLPDGRVQVVSYIADNNGYRADVRYDEDEDSTAGIDHHRQQVYAPQPTSPPVVINRQPQLQNIYRVQPKFKIVAASADYAQDYVDENDYYNIIQIVSPSPIPQTVGQHLTNQILARPPPQRNEVTIEQANVRLLNKNLEQYAPVQFPKNNDNGEEEPPRANPIPFATLARSKGYQSSAERNQRVLGQPQLYHRSRVLQQTPGFDAQQVQAFASQQPRVYSAQQIYNAAQQQQAQAYSIQQAQVFSTQQPQVYSTQQPQIYSTQQPQVYSTQQPQVYSTQQPHQQQQQSYVHYTERAPGYTQHVPNVVHIPFSTFGQIKNVVSTPAPKINQYSQYVTSTPSALEYVTRPYKK